MDSQLCGDGRLRNLIDKEWRKDKLPVDEIPVLIRELPYLVNENNETHLSLKELEKKWNNLALGIFSKNY